VFLRSQVRASDAFVRDVREPMLSGLENLAKTFGADRTVVELAVGDPVTELVRLATECTVDLVVAGEPATRTHAAGVGGDIVDRLLRRLRVPLLQGNGAPAAAPRSVVVAVDGRSDGNRVLAEAAGVAGGLDAMLTAMHVISDDVRAYVRAMEVAGGAASAAPAAEAALWSSAASYLGAEL